MSRMLPLTTYVAMTSISLKQPFKVVASTFFTPPTRPEQRGRPDSGHPCTVQNSPSVQNSPGVQSWTALATDAKTSITHFIAQYDI